MFEPTRSYLDYSVGYLLSLMGNSATNASRWNEIIKHSLNPGQPWFSVPTMVFIPLHRPLEHTFVCL